MSLEAFNAGCNIIGIRKNDHNYGMCCAWSQMIDYDKLTMLLGAQSVTGKILAVGDVVGVSALSLGQKAIAESVGSGHGDTKDKFAAVPHRLEDTAILVDGAKTEMVCRVADILRLPGIEADAFLVLHVLRYRQHADRVFLSANGF